MLPSISLTLAALALAYATFWLGAFDPFRFAIAAIAIALAGLLAFLAVKAPRRPPAFALIPLALIPIYLILTLIALPLGTLATLSPRAAEAAQWLHLPSAPLSLAPNSSLAFTLRILTALTLFFLTRQLATKLRWLTLLPVIAIATLEAILGLIQAANSATVNGTYVNHDHYSFLLEVALPVAVMAGVALLQDSREARNALLASVLFGAATLLLLAIIFSLSRAGFLTALVSLFILAILNLQKRFRARGAAVLAVAFLALFFFLPITSLVLRFSDLASDSTSIEGARQRLWKDSIPLIREFPLFGTGLGGFEAAIRRHQTTALTYNIAYAHNEYIQFLAELGLVGFILFLIPLVWILKVLVNNLDDPLAKAGLASAIAVLLHCIVDFNLQVPANLLTVAWTAGVWASLTAKTSTRPNSVRSDRRPVAGLP